MSTLHSPLDLAINDLLKLLSPYTARLHSLAHSRLVPSPTLKPDSSTALGGNTLTTSTSSTSDLNSISTPTATISSSPPSPFFAALALPSPSSSSSTPSTSSSTSNELLPSHPSAITFVETLGKIIDLQENERQFAVSSLLSESKKYLVKSRGSSSELADAAFFVPGKIRFDLKKRKGKGRQVEEERDERDYVEGSRALSLVEELVRTVVGSKKLIVGDLQQQQDSASGDEEDEDDDTEEELARLARRRAWTAEWKRRGVAKAEERVRDAVLECVIRWKEEKTSRERDMEEEGMEVDS